MILKQCYLGCLAHASYLVADERSKVAAVVDPQRDVDQYVAEAERLGVAIRHVFLTHFHADFVAGHIELRQRTGAAIHLGAQAKAAYAFEPARDGASLDLGPQVRLAFLETPGHTPEGVSILVFDLEKDAEKPRAVLTGDTLFVGDVGRPDLMASSGVTAAELAGRMYDSLHGKLLKLPDETIVYPAHGAGSMCGKALAEETFSTIGAQKRTNYALRPMSRDEFVALVTADQPEAPPYFAYDAALNQKERGTLEGSLDRALVPLDIEGVMRLRNQGAQVVDGREPAAFARGHLAGSFNVPLEGKYATYAGMVLDREKPIVVVADAGREREAAMRLMRIGLDRVVGYLTELPSSAVTGCATTDARALADALSGGDPPCVLDVRMPGEWRGGHVEGSVNIPLHRLAERIAEVPRGRRVAIICRTGHRSSVAQSILEQHGIVDTMNVEGGMVAWGAAGCAR